MRFYYALPPMTALLLTYTALFLAGRVIGAIIGRLSSRKRLDRVLNSRYHDALATLTERSKQESRRIRHLEGLLHAQKCRNAEIAALFGQDNHGGYRMSMKHIRQVYGVPAKRGGRVLYRGLWFGMITGSDGPYIKVRMNGGNRSHLYHPTDHMEYLTTSTSEQEE